MDEITDFNTCIISFHFASDKRRLMRFLRDSLIHLALSSILKVINIAPRKEFIMMNKMLTREKSTELHILPQRPFN